MTATHSLSPAIVKSNIILQKIILWKQRNIKELNCRVYKFSVDSVGEQFSFNGAWSQHKEGPEVIKLFS